LPTAKQLNCPHCGAELPVQAPGGNCLRCLLQLALEASAGPAGTATISEGPGDRIGRYQLLRQIGEGGCGVVYLAEQQEPVRRQVALKVIKLGMDTRQVVARFEAERQALALMDHPNIAKVLDAGATETGRPFFVMELVPGVKITDYCDEHRLSTEERLQLFVQVCQAIQHAHQKSVIHRDIKPSNILVTLQDGRPVPRVIDFGIAKATDQPLTDKTLFTAYAHFIGTPAYMSPEQAELSGLDIDTRSDIYSLGVLLYELLTGKTPFELRSLLVAGLEEILRTIREQEPVPPSTRLDTMQRQELADAAGRRRADPPKLIHQMRGELDWIVMKALEKERARRYETVHGLARDVERHLHNELVLARPPNALYRFHKLVRRNKLAFAAAGAVFISLAVGLGLSTWMFLKEKEARRQAEIEAIKSQQVAGFLQEMLDGVEPSVALGRDTTLLREILDQAAGRVGRELNTQPEVEAELQTTIGGVYQALGQYPKAEAMQRQALAIRRKFYGDDNLKTADSLGHLARALLAEGRLAEAETLARAALATRRKLLGEDNVEVAGSMDLLALVLRYEGRVSAAEPLARAALATRRKLLGEESLAVAGSLNNLGLILDDENKVTEAGSLYQESLAIQQKLLGHDDPNIAGGLNNVAGVLDREGKLAEAESRQRESLAMQRRLFGDEHPAVASAIDNLAEILHDEGELSEAETLSRQALAMRRKLLGEHPVVARSLIHLSGILRDEGKLAEAESAEREGWLMRRKLLGDEHPGTADALNRLAAILAREGKYGEAESLLLEACSRMARAPNTDPVVQSNLYKQLASLYTAWNKPGQAAEWESKLADLNRSPKPAMILKN